MKNVIEYKTTTDRYEIEEWCTTALRCKLHSGTHGMFHKWFCEPKNFKGLAMVFDDGQPIGIAVWLSFKYDADEFADTVNTGCWIKPCYRRIGLGSELITQIKALADEPIHGFTGLYHPNKFWVVNDADGRNHAGIIECAIDLDTTPSKLGYQHMSNDEDEHTT